MAKSKAKKEAKKETNLKPKETNEIGEPIIDETKMNQAVSPK